MKNAIYLSILTVFISCNSNKTPATGTHTAKKNTTVKAAIIAKAGKDDTFKPYKLNEGYTVTDTGLVDATVMETTYAVITQNGKLIDTIDKDFGIQKLNDNTHLYLTITDTAPPEDQTIDKTEYKRSISGSLGNYILVVNGKKQNLSKLTPDFNNYFSSPSVINGKIYFWQIKKIDTAGNNSISAAQYNPVTQKTIAHYLNNDYIETDDAGYFAAPYLKNDTIYFDGANDKLTKFNKDLKLYN
ncbi:hypothetical protein [Mucilaginibacter sp. SP1R1]|uniref:hypothetical protein n=1 Tax=Mucilaginibacter sp. SP1R1 TaxID=2723091 RepID=UPI001617CD1C|nr:hypothetical protein [Mucilaginibacter sp. SP1R1]MBB6149758.1 hypothetical protein [Mucilaginibacter sp. SP1R1]